MGRGKVIRILFLLTIFIPHIIVAENIYFKVIETTSFWRGLEPIQNNIDGEIIEGSIVRAGYSGVLFSHRLGEFENILFQRIYYNDEHVLIFANSIIPLETEDLFNHNLLFNSEKRLIPSFYAQAFSFGDPEIIYLQNRQAWDAQMNFINEDHVYPLEWWQVSVGHINFLLITQTSLTFSTNEKGGSDLLIQSIEETEGGYIITVTESLFSRDRRGREWWIWPNPEEQERFTIFLISDGDYIDLYLHEAGTLIGTFLFVDNEFIYQLHNFIRRVYPVNLSRITTWPRRADGRMDIPPPIDMSDFQATHRTTSRLNVRDNPTTNAPLVTTLELGTEVEILEKGHAETIGEITASWVRVLSADGFTGWCFSGFLEVIFDETDAVENPVPEAPAVIVPQANTVTEGGGMLLWAWFAIIGGIVVAGGAVLVVVRRKKK